MQLTRFTDYALRVLMHLASREDERCTIGAIAASQAISGNHLMKVVHQLARQGYVATLRGKGLAVIESWAPPIPVPDGSVDVVYADQVLEHMNGIEQARQFTAEALRVLRPGGVLYVVVPDYLKERTFFWDVDYTHNFVTTERRVRQLFNDGGLEVLHVERAIGLATGVSRDALAAAAPAFAEPSPPTNGGNGAGQSGQCTGPQADRPASCQSQGGPGG